MRKAPLKIRSEVTSIILRWTVIDITVKTTAFTAMPVTARVFLPKICMVKIDRIDPINRQK